MDKKYYVLLQDCDDGSSLLPSLFSSEEIAVHSYSRRVCMLNSHWRVRLCRIGSFECLMTSSISDARGQREAG